MPIRPLPLALALAATASAAANAAAPIRITVYSGGYDAVVQSDADTGGAGFALIERSLRVDPNAGAGRLALDDLPRAVDPATLRLEGPGLTVTTQRYDFAGLDQAQLLQGAVGRGITVEQAVGSSARSYTGTLLAAGSGLTLREPDGRIRVLANYSGFTLADAPEGLVAKPTLRLQVEGQKAVDATLSYASAGLAWQAEYRVTLADRAGACRMAIDGHALVANRSGADFPGAMLTLVAGEPRRVQASGPQPQMASMVRIMGDSSMAEGSSGVPKVGASAEYHAYPMPQPTDLPDGSLQRLPLLAPVASAACQRRYEVASPLGEWTPPQPLVQPEIGGDGAADVRTLVAFRNDKAEGLGNPLPAGRVRVFDGSDLLGESPLPHTAAGREVELDLGTAFDLSARRSSTDFSVDRSGRTMTETVEWVLSNAKDRAATVRITDRAPRWTDWTLVDDGDSFRKTDAQGLAAEVRVPAGGETTLRYTVRYRWATDIRVD